MNHIIIKDINLGGISDSIFQGRANSVAEAVGLDIHSEPGVIKANQKLSNDVSAYPVNNTGLYSPSGTGGVYNEWTNPTNAYADDSNYATAQINSNYKQDYYNFGLPTIPSTATILGIEVVVKAKNNSGVDRALSVAISKDLAAHVSTWENQNFGATDETKIYGSSTDTWGLTGWTPSSFTNANFAVVIWTGASSTDTFSVNHIQVRVYYRDESNAIKDLVTTILPCSDGNTYLFGSTTGKIWKRTSAGAYSLEATASPAAGAVGIMDAREYQGYIYYSMESRLGRVAVGSPTDWSARDDNFATFTNTDDEFHPLNEVNQVLYIGDKNYVAQVDAGTFSANALDMDTKFRVKSLGRYLTDLLVGTFVNIYNALTEIFRWNTWSVSYSSSDEIPEVGINAFLKADNYILVSCGRKGNIYSYDGTYLNQFKKIPGDWLLSNEATIYPNASENYYGLPLFGLSNVSGNPAKQGIYSLGGYDRGYPKVLNLEWLISAGGYAGVDIGAIKVVGTDLLVSWKYVVTATMTIASPCVVTWTAHGRSNGDQVIFSTTGALPTGITAGTFYYVRVIDANTFHLYDTYAHALATGETTGRVNTSGTQSGTQSITMYGVDKLDSTAKVASAYFGTRVINADRGTKKDLFGYVAYKSLPTGTSIKIYYKVNHDTSWTEATSTIDTDRKIIEIDENLPEANIVRVKVELNSNANNSPEVEQAEFFFN
jgi:hypothetical protein